MTDSSSILTPALVTEALEHMNTDHADAVLAYARGLAGLAWAEQARLTRLDVSGMDLLVSAGERRESTRIAFEEPLTTAAQLRPVLITLARRARERLVQ